MSYAQTVWVCILLLASVQELNVNAIWPTRSSRASDTGKPENLMASKKQFDIDQIMNDMESMTDTSNSTFFRAQQKDSWLSNVKIIPDEHHVSAFLNKGIVKRLMCIDVPTSGDGLIDNGKFSNPETLKSFRTQKTVSFKTSRGKRGVYGVEVKALYRDSYVHLYATSFSEEPLRITPSAVNDNFDRSAYVPWSNIYDGLNPRQWTTASGQRRVSDFQSSVGSDFHPSYAATSRPKVSAKRLRGNRLHVKWDTSPVNPHLMQYCIVVNTRRDYTSLCGASGERYGVLPPDLMHVVYYGSETYFEEDGSMWDEPQRYAMHQAQPLQNVTFGPNPKEPNKNPYHHHIRHDRNKIKRQAGYTHNDIIIGCVGKRTNHILHNLHEGMLYYVNIFVRDMLTNVSYPYVRTTAKYHAPKSSNNGLKDATPTKIKLPVPTSAMPGPVVASRSIRKPTTLRFHLGKPCSELVMYLMPCGGGTVSFELQHENQTLVDSKNVDSLDVVKVQSPKRGKYVIKIFQSSSSSLARMVEVYVGKKTKRFPLPKLPAITKVSEDESRRTCDGVMIQWWPSPDSKDNEYCIFLKEETRRKRIFQFKKPNQCDLERSLKSDPYVTMSLCLQRDIPPDGTMLSQNIVGLLPGKVYIVQVIVKRHNGKALSYDLHHVKTDDVCDGSEKK